MPATRIPWNRRPARMALLVAYILAFPTGHLILGQTNDRLTLNTKAEGYRGIWSVSYTHLTLPTSDLV